MLYGCGSEVLIFYATGTLETMALINKLRRLDHKWLFFRSSEANLLISRLLQNSIPYYDTILIEKH